MARDGWRVKCRTCDRLSLLLERRHDRTGAFAQIAANTNKKQISVENVMITNFFPRKNTESTQNDSYLVENTMKNAANNTDSPSVDDEQDFVDFFATVAKNPMLRGFSVQSRKVAVFGKQVDFPCQRLQPV